MTPRLVVQLNLFNTIPLFGQAYRNTNGIFISRVTCRVGKQENVTCPTPRVQLAGVTEKLNGVIDGGRRKIVGILEP